METPVSTHVVLDVLPGITPMAYPRDSIQVAPTYSLPLQFIPGLFGISEISEEQVSLI